MSMHSWEIDSSTFWCRQKNNVTEKHGAAQIEIFKSEVFHCLWIKSRFLDLVAGNRFLVGPRTAKLSKNENGWVCLKE